MNKRFALLIATCGGIGSNVGGGTIISFVMAPFFYVPLPIKALLTFILIGLAYLTIPYAQKYYKKDDPHEIVIDEAIGALLLLFCLQATWTLSLYQILVGLLLFRIFDITKIGGIKHIEALPGATGVILDDIAAALYAYFLMYLFV
jgi:phosphatidylglycerophosphatase A